MIVLLIHPTTSPLISYRSTTEKRFVEGSIETKVPTMWTDEKHSQEEAEPGRNSAVEKTRREKIRDGVRREKMQVSEKVGKSRNTVFFQWFVAPEGRKVGWLKRRVRSQLAR